MKRKTLIRWAAVLSAAMLCLETACRRKEAGSGASPGEPGLAPLPGQSGVASKTMPPVLLKQRKKNPLGEGVPAPAKRQ